MNKEQTYGLPMSTDETKKRQWGIWYYKYVCHHEDGNKIYMVKIRSVKEHFSDVYTIFTFGIKTKTPTKVLRELVGLSQGMTFTKDEMKERIENLREKN